MPSVTGYDLFREDEKRTFTDTQGVRKYAISIILLGKN